ncbi:MAG: exodeoxyribonuclease VII small subunit [Candidatus Omnitrophota bacterium]
MTQEISFEKALERLEKIVQELESGDVALEDALKKFEEGVKLSRFCQEKLSKAEKKIQLLTENPDGTFRREDFTAEEDETRPARKGTRTPSRKSASAADEETLI